jgi:hypothetical protein
MKLYITYSQFTLLTLYCTLLSDFIPAGHRTRKQSISLQDEQLLTLRKPLVAI